MSPFINTDQVSARYRQLAVDVPRRRLLIARIGGSAQEADLTSPPNCHGFGRIRHFEREAGTAWPPNPLPIEPAANALGLSVNSSITAQAFQNAACNWRCWYCYVPYTLLSASPKYSEWLTAEQLVDMYVAEANRPPMIDLTGGQPDLVPEWVPWMMRALRDRGLSRSVYLWSDDNLSNDYLRRYLSDADLALMESYQSYGRVGCFKGYDSLSFSFNTRADPNLFERQLQIMNSILDLRLDTYAYVTLTTPERETRRIQAGVRRFVDRLQEIDENLPLRTVPLEIQVFHTVEDRIHDQEMVALAGQEVAIAQWKEELIRRYPATMRERSIAEIRLGRTKGREASGVVYG